MMNYDLMSGVGGSNMMLFAWVTYILVVVLLVLGIDQINCFSLNLATFVFTSPADF